MTNFANDFEKILFLINLRDFYVHPPTKNHGLEGRIETLILKYPNFRLEKITFLIGRDSIFISDLNLLKIFIKKLGEIIKEIAKQLQLKFKSQS